MGKTEAKQKRTYQKSIILDSTKLSNSINSMLENSKNLEDPITLSTEASWGKTSINRCVYQHSSENSNNLSVYKQNENISDFNSGKKIRKVSTSEFEDPGNANDFFAENNINSNKKEENGFEIQLEQKENRNFCCNSETQCVIF